MEKKYKIEEYGVSFVSTQKLERTYNTRFCLAITSGLRAFSQGPFEISMAASKLRRAPFGHLRVDF